MKKIISFSLWGDSPKYTVGAIKNAELAQTIYPGWECYFFIGQSVPESIKNQLLKFPNITLFYKAQPENWTGMFWRFETCYDSDVYVSIFRDTDSRLSTREKYAVDQWLESDKTFHIMRDHPHHGFPILGGMWGYKKNDKYDMRKLLTSFDKTNRYGTDYEFFGNVLYPMIGDDKIVHDPFFDKKPFPTERLDREFVGDVFDESNNRHPEYYKYIPILK
jgi:hypothetical protein